MKTYRKAVTETFSFMKSAKDKREAYLKATPIDGGGFLIPVTNLDLGDESAIEDLTNWRNTNVEAYPSRFRATGESTKTWLRNRLLDCPDRILFFVVNEYGNRVGHMGFCNCINDRKIFEVDNVARGVEGDKGIMSRAIISMIEWARTTMPVDGFELRVFVSNPSAIAFYERLGFSHHESIPLVAESTDDTLHMRNATDEETADDFFSLMTFQSCTPVGNQLILTAGPSITSREACYAFDAATNGWNRNWANYLDKFEQEFAAYVGCKYALATSSCTGALQIALMSLGIGPGDEVIVPDQTWVATANAVRYSGATPVFADVELDTWTLDPGSVERLITAKTRAIIAVHMYGHPTRMDGISDLVDRYGLRLIEDAAPAIGAEWKGKRCGSFGDFAAFSFQGAKLMVTGEGGMLVTNNEDLFLTAKKIWDQGRNPDADRAFWIDEKGVKFKMSNVQAAIGLGQLERVDELIEMKRRIFHWYSECLKDTPWITLNHEASGARSIYWMTSILIQKDAPFERNQLMQHLRENNIDTRPVFPAISQYPIWDETVITQPNAKNIGDNGINLPSGVCLKRAEVEYVGKTISEFIQTHA